MNCEALFTLLESFTGASSDHPFGPGALVFKVAGKMFALVDEDALPLRLSLKCDPDLAQELRALYPDRVLPGYHLNKRHWNTIILDDTLPADEVNEWIGHSYDLVVAGLSRRLRDELS